MAWASRTRGWAYIIQEVCFAQFALLHPVAKSLIKLSKQTAVAISKQRLRSKVKDLHSSLVQWSQLQDTSDSRCLMYVQQGQVWGFFVCVCWQFVSTVTGGRRVDGRGRARKRRQQGKESSRPVHTDLWCDPAGAEASASPLTAHALSWFSSVPYNPLISLPYSHDTLTSRCTVPSNYCLH